jgi:hypothetical protein
MMRFFVMYKNRFLLGILMGLCAQLGFTQGLLTYRPPMAGAPTTRVGGGTRGLSAEMPHLEVLAPVHTAFTAQAQPILYWYLSRGDVKTVEISIIQEGVSAPLLERTLPSISQAGLQSIRLSDYGVSLQAGQEYRWSVAVVNDPEQRSGDIVASATIRYQLPSTPLNSIEQQAEAGYWYDALHGLVSAHSPLINDFLKQIDLNIPAL